jgi:hypothetical protein
MTHLSHKSIGSRSYTPPTAPASTSAFPTMAMPIGRCPGCFKTVSPMEFGTTAGPQGTRWHSLCLVCGGEEAKKRNGRRDGDKPGCGKKLDSAAKVTMDGGVLCRECVRSYLMRGFLTNVLLKLLLSPVSRGSPTRIPPPSQAIGAETSFWSTRLDSESETPNINRQLTGRTSLAYHHTGSAQPSLSRDAVLMRQLTGGGLSPTRQLGTMGIANQFTGSSVRRQTTGGGTPLQTHLTGDVSMVNTNITGGRMPRPKSVGPMTFRGKSVDEGRGMFLVRQMTGGTGTFHAAN